MMENTKCPSVCPSELNEKCRLMSKRKKTSLLDRNMSLLCVYKSFVIQKFYFDLKKVIAYKEFYF